MNILRWIYILNISRYCNLKTTDISAPKLGSFVLDSQPIDLHIANASCLLEVYLSLTICLYSEMNLGIANPAAMPNLQHLELQAIVETEQSLRGWTSFIAASPNLQKLTFKLNTNYTQHYPNGLDSPSFPQILRHIGTCWLS